MSKTLNILHYTKNISKVYFILFVIATLYFTLFISNVIAEQNLNIKSISPIYIGNIKTVNPLPSITSDSSVANDQINNVNTEMGKILNISAISQDMDVTRVTFDVSKNFSTEVKILNFPFKVMFDVPRPYEWDVPQNSLDNPVLSQLIQTVKYGYPDDKTFRIVADLKKPVNVDRAYLIPDIDKNKNYKFVIDLKPANILTNLLSSSVIVVPTTQVEYLKLQKQNDSNNNIIIDKKRLLAINKWFDSYLNNVQYPAPILVGNNKAKVVVVIDPGHGGKDPGAQPVSDSTIKEKNIVLSIAKFIQEDLIKNQEISVLLTRRGDYFVPLKDRILWAKKYNADLFVSIHADRAVSDDSSGLSVYTLSEKASDAQTQVIATDQNKSDIIAGVNIDSDDDEVSKILISLLQRIKVNDSVILAKDILSSASENIKLLVNPLRSAGFVVLQIPETPSVLIETGFLSNNKDVHNLINLNYQKIIAQKIADGIEQYLWENKKLKIISPYLKNNDKSFLIKDSSTNKAESNTNLLSESMTLSGKM